MIRKVRTYTDEQKAAKLARQRKWRAANPHKISNYRRAYAVRHPDKIRERANRYYARHRIRRMAEARLRHHMNKERLNAQSRARYAKNRLARRAYAIDRYNRNKPQYIARAERWVALNRTLHNSYTRKSFRKAVEELRPWYVRSKLSRRTAIRSYDWPNNFVELVKTKMKVNRLCRESKT